jgi:hypothetical protein
MEEIIYIENELSLAMMETELKALGIEYFVKKSDINVLPININKMPYAVLFYDIKNRDIVLEICENIKIGENIENEEKQLNGTNKILKNIILLVVFIFLIIIIVSQAITYNNLLDSINRPSKAYTYKYLNNGKEMEVHFKKDDRRFEKYIDNNQNGINERVEIHYSNGMVTIYEDKNENGSFEYEGTYRDNELLYESFSTKDNDIFDIMYYYNNGKIEQKVLYDEEKNKIIIE